MMYTNPSTSLTKGGSMTEEQARTKWCPMVRLSVGYDDYGESHVAVNRWNRYESALYSKCVASDCMMWRETEPKKYGVPRDGKTSEPTGYCGLAK